MGRFKCELHKKTQGTVTGDTHENNLRYIISAVSVGAAASLLVCAPGHQAGKFWLALRRY